MTNIERQILLNQCVILETLLHVAKPKDIEILTSCIETTQNMIINSR